MNNNDKRNDNLRLTLHNIEKVLIDAHERRMGYSSSQLNAFSSLKDSISNRIADTKNNKRNVA